MNSLLFSGNDPGIKARPPNKRLASDTTNQNGLTFFIGDLL